MRERQDYWGVLHYTLWREKQWIQIENLTSKMAPRGIQVLITTLNLKRPAAEFNLDNNLSYVTLYCQLNCECNVTVRMPLGSFWGLWHPEYLHRHNWPICIHGAGQSARGRKSGLSSTYTLWPLINPNRWCWGIEWWCDDRVTIITEWDITVHCNDRQGVICNIYAQCRIWFNPTHNI